MAGETQNGQPAGKSLASKTAEGATFLILLQVGSRALTFAVNQFLLRYLSPELLGISTQLELYAISVLFFSRESLRVAVQRQADASETPDVDKEKKSKAADKTQTIVNLSYISIALGLVFAFFLAWSYARSSDPVILRTPYFAEALKLYGIAAIWELLAEPCFVVVQQKSRYKIRAGVETVATVLRCFVTCASALWAARTGRDLGVLPFALGQGAYGLTLLVLYYWSTWKLASLSGFSLTPRPIVSSDADYLASYFSKPLLALGRSLFMQTLVKHVLTQGDTLLISWLASPQAIGVYALASNYGGLIARMVFQPIEEMCRNYFGKLLSSTTTREAQKKTTQTASRDLHRILKLYALLSVTAVALGPSIAPLLLGIVAGPRWSAAGAGHVLGRYCYYIPLLAVNGVTEAFISAVASKSELDGQSAWMLAFSAGFAGAGYLFLEVLGLGAEGLVWANVINMAFRILWSFNFINKYLSARGSRLDISSLMPQWSTLAASAGTVAVLHQMQESLASGFAGLTKAVAMSLPFLTILVGSEYSYLKECYNSFRA